MASASTVASEARAEELGKERRRTVGEHLAEVLRN